jgi:hypothetical protein
MNVYDPDLSFETATEDLTPRQAHDRWESATNLQADDLRRLRQTQEHKEYLDAASEQRQTEDPPIAGGPLDDAIHLAETPADEWGPDERAEAEEALNYGSRALPQFSKSEGEDVVPGDPKTSKAYLALARWGFDPVEDDGFP